MSAQKIRELAEALRIPMLVHFTRTENLASIFQHGLMPVAQMAAAGVGATVNDYLRLDGRLNGVSTSIAFPNAQMFFKLRNDNPEVDWCVLGLHPSILWEKDVLFCKHNAADGRISCVANDDLKTPEAFSSMYDKVEGLDARADQKVKPFDPTDVQAEVLVLGTIEPKYIGAVVFTSEAAKAAHVDSAGDRKLIVRKPPKGFFANRKYHRTYG